MKKTNTFGRIAASVILAVGFTFAAQATIDRNGLDWSNKKVSILGDSYSTYDGVSPHNGIYYPTGDVTSRSYTWWDKVINGMGATLEKNCSWGSSCISTNNYKSSTSRMRASFLSRARGDDDGDGVAGDGEGLGNPDIIIVFGGLNDEWNKSQLQVDAAGHKVDISTSLAKSRAKELFSWLKTNHSSAKIFFMLMQSKGLGGTGLDSSNGFRAAFQAAATESSIEIIDLIYAPMAKTDFDSAAHINKSGHAKYAARVLNYLQGGADVKSATWNKTTSAQFMTAANWTPSGVPDGNTDVYFPSNKTLTVVMSGSNLQGTSHWGAFQIGANCNITFSNTGSSYIENWGQATHDYTFAGDNANITFTRASGVNNEFQVFNANGTTYIGNNVSITATKNAKLKLGEVNYVNKKNLHLDANNGFITLNTKAQQTMTNVGTFYARCVGATKNDATINLGDTDFKGANDTVTLIGQGGTMYFKTCSIQAGVAQIELTGACDSVMGVVSGVKAGSYFKLYDTANVAFKGDFSFGVVGSAVVEVGGSNPQLVGAAGSKVEFGQYATLKLKPKTSWSADKGRFFSGGQSKDNKPKHIFPSTLKYEIDVTDFANIASAKKFCLASITNVDSNVYLNYNIPPAENVTLTGTGKDDLQATFSKDSYHFYVTISPKPQTQASFGYEKEYTDHGVTYGLVAFTNTTQAFSWNVPSGITTVDILAVGGGGAGGAAKADTSKYCGAGGGGAGAVLYKEGLTVAGGQTFTVQVGKGGLASKTAVPGDGGASWVTNTTANIRLTAAGGGHGGGCVSAAGGNGGCGGGGYGAGVLGGLSNGLGLGNRGGTGAETTKTNRKLLGGGGAGAGFSGPSASSINGCSGGGGIFSRITGASVCYGGGGGSGGAQADSAANYGGNGGGGQGGDEAEGKNGTDGLGGGGGGGSSKTTTTVYAGGNGGAGVVYIRYVKNMGTAAVPSALSPNGVQVNVHNAKQKEFLAMTAAQIRSSFNDSTWRGNISKQGDCLPLPVTFSWNGGGINTVNIYNADGSLFLSKTVRGNSTEMWGFDIGTNYTWEVVNSVNGASARAAFTTEFEVPRMLRDPNFDEVDFDGVSTCTRKLTGVINMRELGGYTGLQGKKIRTGLLYRNARICEHSSLSWNPGHEKGDSFNRTAATSNFWQNVLKVKTQFDLRDQDEYGDLYVDNELAGPLGPTVHWVKFTTDLSVSGHEQAIPCYDAIFTDHGKENYGRLLARMMDPANLPLVFHCSAGKDRTGTVAYILESILGVSDEDKFRDWVALVLSSTDTQFSPTAAFDPLVAGFSSYSGATQNDKVVSFVKSLGISDAQINTFRNAVLEGGYSEGGHVHVYGNWVTNPAPDCVTSGVRYRDCTAAGCTEPPARITEQLAALGHSWGAWTTTVQPQVGVAGEKQRTCSRCSAVETEVIPALEPEVKTHPYTANWTGSAGDNAWGTAGNWADPMTSEDAAYFPISANVTIPVNGTAGTAFTAGAGTYVKVMPGSGNTAEFNAASGSFTLCEEGATFEAYGPTGWRAYAPGGIILRSGSTVKATGGCYIKIPGLICNGGDDGDAITFVADGTDSQIKLSYTSGNTSAENFIADNGGRFTCEGTISGSPKISLDNGAYMLAYQIDCDQSGASVEIGANSTLNLHDEDDRLTIGSQTATMKFSGANPQLLNGSWDGLVSLGANLTLTLVPELSWSATDGRIVNNNKHNSTAVSAGVKYVIDVKNLGNLAAPKTFALVSSIGTSEVNSTFALPAEADVTVLFDGEPTDNYTVSFSSTAKAMFFTVTQVATQHVHVWDSGVVTLEPTCTDAGEKTYTCTAPGCTNPAAVNVVEIPALGHTEVNVPAVPATCTTAGSTAGVRCSVCNEWLTAPTTVNALGHSFGDWVVDTPAQVGVAGAKHRTCTRTGCGYTENEVIPALPESGLPSVYEGGWTNCYTVGTTNYAVIAVTNTTQAYGWTIPAGVEKIDLLVVGGGGAGGGKYDTTAKDAGFGGGAGGGFNYIEGQSVIAGAEMTVKVGAGGAATTSSSSNGGASYVSNTVYNIGIASLGGGAGGTLNEAGKAGANGGGAGGSYSGNNVIVKNGGAATQADGYAGGSSGAAKRAGGGGAGAGEVGAQPESSRGGTGGEGRFCSITGEEICYAGGGGAGGYCNPGGNGGNGGGGRGGHGEPEKDSLGEEYKSGVAGTDGLGGGGGGSAEYATKRAGGKGGSGIVIIRYIASIEAPVVDPEVATVAPAVVSPNGVEVELHTALQKEFLAKSEQERRDCFTNATYRNTLNCDYNGSEPKKTPLTWTGDGLCTVTVKRASDNKVVFTTSLVGNTVDVDQLEIAGSYTWSVSNSLGTASGTFTTEAEAPRLLRNPGSNAIRRIRDLGGRPGLDGKRVKQNLVFRCSQFNNGDTENYINDTNRSFWLDFLGIKTDMDLRSDGEKGSNWQSSSPLGNTVIYVKPEIGSYSGLFTNPKEDKIAFNTFFDYTKYPIVFHCVAGRDRTGCLAYVLNAILGVDEQELIKDWEVNAFADPDLNFKHVGNLDAFRNTLATYAPFGTVCDQATAFVKSLGYTDDQINGFRNYMLEGGYTPPAPPVVPDISEMGWSNQYTSAGVTYAVIAVTNTTKEFTWSVPAGVEKIDLLVVGGGGAGGGKYSTTAKDSGFGGGGGGGFNYIEQQTVIAGAELTIKVGAGGTATTSASGKGGASYVTNAVYSLGVYSDGGGYGGTYNAVGTSGASGGGGGGGFNGTANVVKAGGSANGLGTGFAGGSSSTGRAGGGGGGAGAAGAQSADKHGGAGGNGLPCSITGNEIYYAGGGGGGGNCTSGGAGGQGGGGNGGHGEPQNDADKIGKNGLDGLGGGGGGSASENTIMRGGKGGSGIVIIRYASPSVVPPIDPPVVPGGVTTNAMSNGWGYEIHGLGSSNDEVALVFTNTTATMDWTVPTGVSSVRYLIVAGGGAGGKASTGTACAGGGGGAGGLLQGNLAVSAGTQVGFSVGAGGVNASGDNSVVTLGGAAIATAIGGGKGGDGNLSLGLTGGSAGGNGWEKPNGVAGIEGQGNAGGGCCSTNGYGGGGGGGGAGEAGAYNETTSGAKGGNGIASDITGASIYYAGGGGGGGRNNGGASGGLGGGGKGGKGNGTTGVTPTCGAAGVNGLGGGGGGSGRGYTSAGGKGGDGVIIIRYSTGSAPADPIPAEIVAAKSGDAITIPSGATVSVSDDGETLTVNGKNYETKAHYVFDAADGIRLVIDPAEAVVLSIEEKSASVMEIGTVQTVSGFYYRVKYADNLQFTGAQYSNYTDGDGEIHTIDAPRNGAKCFYKLVVEDVKQ